MAATKVEDSLSKIQALLKLLMQEKIATYEGTSQERRTSFSKTLHLARNLLPSISKQMFPHGLIAPGMTSNVATTFLKVAACQELSQRFCLEYFLSFKQQNINLIMLTNPKDFSLNHVLVAIGDVNVKDELLIGRGDNQATIPDSKHHVAIDTFWSEQKDELILVDPLLNFAGSAEDAFALNDYCKENGITHVDGVRSFKNSIGIMEHAAQVKKNAHTLACKIRHDIIKTTLDEISATKFKMASWAYHEKQNCFFLKDSREKLEPIMKFLDSQGLKGFVQIVQGVITGEPMLVVKSIDLLSLQKIVDISMRYMMDESQAKLISMRP